MEKKVRVSEVRKNLYGLQLLFLEEGRVRVGVQLKEDFCVFGFQCFIIVEMGLLVRDQVYCVMGLVGVEGIEGN